MKKILLIILFISVGFSQQKWNMEFMREYGGVTYAPNSDKPYTGKVYSFYESGETKEEGKYRNGLKDGIWKYWDENGIIDSTGQYTHGKKNGEWTFNKYKGRHSIKYLVTYHNGKKSGSDFAIDSLGNKYIYKNYLVDIEGVKYEKNIKTPYTGPVMKKWDNGKIQSIGYYKDGLRDGNWEFWLDVGWDDPFSTFKIMSGKYKDGTAINWEIASDLENNVYEKFDLTITSDETKGFVENNSGELIIDHSWVRIKVYAEGDNWSIHYPGQDGKFGETSEYLIDVQENHIGLDRNSEFGKDDFYTINQLHIPVNTNVLLEITTSPIWWGSLVEVDEEVNDEMIDLIHHTLLIPELNLLQEARLGAWNNIKINVKDTGRYTMRCVHYCGIGAYRHKGFVTIDEKDRYQQWLDEEAEYILIDDDDW